MLFEFLLKRSHALSTLPACGQHFAATCLYSILRVCEFEFHLRTAEALNNKSQTGSSFGLRTCNTSLSIFCIALLAFVNSNSIYPPRWPLKNFKAGGSFGLAPRFAWPAGGNSHPTVFIFLKQTYAPSTLCPRTDNIVLAISCIALSAFVNLN